MEWMFLFLLSSILMEAESGGKLWIKLVNFSNSAGRGANGHYCDGKYFIRGSDCDHRFIICLDSISGPQDTNTCAYGRASTGTIHNTNHITFGKWIGATPNPMTFPFNKWTGSCKLKIDIFDTDDNSDDYVDFMATYYFKFVPDYNETTAMVTTRSLKHRVSMTVQFKVYCDPDYYGPACDVYCERSEKYVCNRYSGLKICKTGWTGPDCDVKTDACASIPCQNDATCHNSLGSFLCVCKPGYTGDNCEEEIDECLNTTCYNDGICVDVINGFECECPDGYTGPHCNTLTDLCISDPCLNNGSCLMDTNDVTFRCQCTPGWTGHVCTDDIDECKNDVCKNNGTCENSVGNFVCHCPGGWDGDLCQEDQDECKTVECFGNSTCVNTNGSFHCLCQNGFTGHLCEKNIDECLSLPCLNGGACKDEVDGYSCKCSKGYKGLQCETEIDECSDFPVTLHFYLYGHINESEREPIIFAIRKMMEKYFHPNTVQHMKFDWSIRWLEDDNGIPFSNVAVIMFTKGTNLCGETLEGFLVKHNEELLSQLSHQQFKGNLTNNQRPGEIMEQNMLYKPWIKNNWYLLMVAAGAVLLAGTILLVLLHKRRKRKMLLNASGVGNNIHWRPDLGAMNTLPSLSFENDLYQTADTLNHVTSSEEQTTENHVEQQPINGTLSFSNNTYQRAVADEQIGFMNHYEFEENLE